MNSGRRFAGATLSTGAVLANGGRMTTQPAANRMIVDAQMQLHAPPKHHALHQNAGFSLSTG